MISRRMVQVIEEHARWLEDPANYTIVPVSLPERVRRARRWWREPARAWRILRTTTQRKYHTALKGYGIHITKYGDPKHWVEGGNG